MKKKPQLHVVQLLESLAKDLEKAHITGNLDQWDIMLNAPLGRPAVCILRRGSDIAVLHQAPDTGSEIHWNLSIA